MNELQIYDEYKIKRHDFEKAKNNIKIFSENKIEDIEIPHVATDRLIFFSHNVTGKELNSITNKIEKHLIKLNERQNEFIDEFGEVYKALESLDKDYISGILSGIKAAEQASNQAIDASVKATDASEQAMDAIREAKIAQNNINKTMEVTIEKFKEFKSRLDSYKHLKDIDEIWESYNYICFKLGEIDEENKRTIKLRNNYHEVIDKFEELNDCIQTSLKNINNKINTLENNDSMHLSTYQDLNNKIDNIQQKLHLLEQNNENNLAKYEKCIENMKKNQIMAYIAIVIAILSIAVNYLRGI